MPSAEPSLFDGLETGRNKDKQKRERPVARGACPLCSADSIGLSRSPDGRHLVWRMHDFVTFTGTHVPCQATAQHLCAFEARIVPGVPTPTCPHQ